MDTKSTKNKILKDLEKYVVLILVILFSISLLGILREYIVFKSRFKGDFYDNNLIQSQIINLDNTLQEYISLYLDLDGDKKEDGYKKKLEEIKLDNQKILQKAENNIREKAKDMNIPEEEIKKQIEEAKEIILQEDNSVDNYFSSVRDSTNNLLYGNENIEFFFKDNSGAKITNIEDSDIEKQIEEKSFTSNEKYYYMYFPSSKIKDNKSFSSQELINLFNSMDYNSEDLVRFYRIPKELKEGDVLYSNFLNRKEATTALNKKVITTSVLGILTLVFAFIIYKNRKNKSTSYIEDLLIKIPLDIRAIFFIYSFNALKSLIFNVIPYYGNDYYSNGVILKSYVFIIFDYYFIKNILLILNNKRDIGKLFILKVYKFMKNRPFVKNNKFKITFIISISALALFSIWLESYIYLPFNTMMIIKGYQCAYIIITSIMSVMIFREVTILESKTLEVTRGNYKYDLKDNKIMILKNIEKNLVTIEDGLTTALDKAIKSEKMKSELITNVSHDLKTPLTSIINYIGLLKEEDITDKNRNKYLEVLDMKSKRLKILIEDLFEASKAVSGNMSFEKEELNIVSLLRQVIGELEEKINQANLDIITKWPEEKTVLYLDGRKTFRVYENLINNIIKYSMKNSRVYIDIINSENEVVVVMKNISAYQIDFNSEEIIERFKRGDEARSTEGSGLGLSIAKSIVELQGGEFNIEIDGDLFKVTTKFKK